MIVAAIFATAWLGQTQGWIAPKTLVLDGFEKVGQGKQMPYRIQSAKGKIALATQKSILGWSSNTTRLESKTQDGSFAWLEGSNRVLRLSDLTYPDISSWLAPIRFSPETLRSGSISGWRTESTETIAQRACWKIKSASSIPQSLWIDQSLGLTLRQEDSGEDGRLRYSRFVTECQVDVPLSDSLFERPANGFVLSGIPHPSILERPKLSTAPEDYQRDLKQVEAKSQFEADLWLKKIVPPSGFDYSGTYSEESVGRAVKEIWPKDKISGVEIEPTPKGIKIDSEVTPDQKNVIVNVLSTNNGDKVTILLARTDAGRTFIRGLVLTRKDDEFGVSTYVDKAGNLFIGHGSDVRQARLRRENLRLKLAKASVVVQSDFVNVDSGDTFSFLQVRGRDWRTCVLLPNLGSPSSLQYEGWQFNTWVLKGNFPLQLLSWTMDGTTYIVASSSLSTEELAKIAVGSAKI